MGIKYSICSPSSGLIIILLLLLISFPNSIVPEISASTAGFFGFLDSKISATLGSPPVISFVFEDALGILAITSPALTSLPFSILRTIPTLRSYEELFDEPFDLTEFPSLSVITNCGFKSCLPWKLFQSIITLDEIPVVSSNFSINETPSTRSAKSNLPVSSATIGTV